MKRAIFRRLPSVDLTTAGIDPDSESLLLDSIPDVTGLLYIDGLANLKSISMVHCGTSVPVTGSGRAALTRIQLHLISQGCLKSILSLTNMEEIQIEHSDASFLDLGSLAHCKRLKILFVKCGLVKGLRHVKGFQLEKVHVRQVEMNEEFLGSLASWSGTLQELWVEHGEPFAPDSLPALPHLVNLKVTYHPETGDLWKSWAAARPNMKLRFEPVAEPSAKLPLTKLEEIYKDVAIMKVTTGKKNTYEAWRDFTEISPIMGNNHDIRDWLEKSNLKALKKVTLFSEADEMGISAAKIEDINACIDAILDGNTSGKSK